MLMFISTQAIAVGPVFEKGVDTSKTLSCDPPTTRTDGAALTTADLAKSTYTLTNTDTTIAESADTDIYCNKVFDLNAMAPGQYEITATATDTDGRESADSAIYSFLLIPTVQPPSAPTGITLQ